MVRNDELLAKRKSEADSVGVDISRRLKFAKLLEELCLVLFRYSNPSVNDLHLQKTLLHAVRRLNHDSSFFRELDRILD